VYSTPDQKIVGRTSLQICAEERAFAQKIVLLRRNSRYESRLVLRKNSVVHGFMWLCCFSKMRLAKVKISCIL